MVLQRRLRRQLARKAPSAMGSQPLQTMLKTRQSGVLVQLPRRRSPVRVQGCCQNLAARASQSLQEARTEAGMRNIM